MRKYILPLLMLLSLSVFAAEERIKAQTIELKDGSMVTVQKDGTMVHIDAAGNRECHLEADHRKWHPEPEVLS